MSVDYGSPKKSSKELGKLLKYLGKTLGIKNGKCVHFECDERDNYSSVKAIWAT